VIYAVVLAAGASTRMGSPKALLDEGGQTFVQRIVETARQGGVVRVLVVIGPPHGEAIRSALPNGVGSAFNPRPERGMLSSVQAGIAALPPGAGAAVVWPVDIPYVLPSTVRAIVDAEPGRLVIPQRGPRGGHPIRIPSARFAELLAIDPERGLRALVDAQPDRVLRLPVDDPGVLVDVDTPADYARGAPAR
jgi:CTP:molybdopterin cytidylyltransferase MocA